MKYKVTVKYKGKKFVSDVEEGTRLLDHIRELDIDFDSPCGGNGTCGKCRVKVNSDQPMSEKEAQLLGKTAIKKGCRLACYHHINSDTNVNLDSETSHKITKTAVHDIVAVAKPDVEFKHISVNKATLEDQRAYLDKILDIAELNLDELALDLIYKLNNYDKKKDNQITTISFDNQLIDVVDGWIEKTYSLAVDVGTTTVAVYLVDAYEAKIIDVESFFNPQRKFGADVISRIDYVNKTNNLKLLNNVLIDSINEAISKLVDRNKISEDLIYSAFFVGNTVMIHILLMLDPRDIANAPFIPETTNSHRTKALDLGIEINRNGLIINIPMVSGYIGADTVAAVLASGMYDKDEVSLLLDLGTNGEIVLGNNKFLMACSAAAGPAFEGANIRNGMGGVPGAIDMVKIDNDIISITTIHNEKPKGMCGSAIIDSIGQFLIENIIEETGRFYDLDEVRELGEKLKKRRVKLDGMEAFIIQENFDTGEVIAITQKDIREVQNAKAAIAAGIKVLIEEKGLKESDVKKVYLAGGFGNYVDVKNATKIGLIPGSLEDVVVSIGNAAGAGAVLCAISGELFSKSIELSDGIDYIELSSKASFTNHFMEEMIFE